MITSELGAVSHSIRSRKSSITTFTAIAALVATRREFVDSLRLAPG
ncbi:hypothetical protein SAMN05421684_8427 [Asanoa ishikariensis]|uniref:Uncharacterized protein n=1 Tax=Asanoa ishikariensis TaxID=137265 RepID=A0A1H3UYI8_9ACTN|nr:hypothetical protein SAMN05421684_8427 [Asanoa ishikariensis]